MTRPEPHPLDVTFLLHAAELLPGDPQVDGLGPPYAAVARVNASAMERGVYATLHLKATALLQTLAKLPCLEHSNEAFASHATEAYLALGGHRLEYLPKAAVALVRVAAAGTLGVPRIARQLRNWTTT
ncbi:fic family toxin-antitoxin system, toxin component [Streptomyces sp. NBC_00390]|uniref:fic family toxin-antitoxin system, toxin component n=1 Tax=Streptomyces sp. NBC_00390 TaxID=2975736 RepID=UPI002E1BE810